MYPLPAVLVNCPDSAVPDLRAALAEDAVAVAAEFASADEVLAPPSRWRPDDRHLFLIRVRSLDEVGQLARLDTAFPANPVLALVEGDYDAAALFRVNRAGAAQILPLPFARPDLAAALDRMLLQFGMQKTPCRVIAVGGATEGCGATTVAVNLAAELAALSGLPCALTELTRGLGRLAGLLNLTPPLTTADVLTGPDGPNLPTVQTALVRAGERLSVLAGPYRALPTTRAPLGAVPQLVRVLRQLAGFVVLDLPATFDADYFEAIGTVDRLVLVVRQDVPSVQSAKVLVESLRERGRPDPTLLINSYSGDHEEFEARRIAELLGLPRAFTVHADAETVRTAANCGRPLSAIRPSCPVARDFHRLAAELLREAGVPIHESRPTVWRWVREKLGLNSL